MKGLDKGGQGPTSGCCAIEEEAETLKKVRRNIMSIDYSRITTFYLHY
jgi:hypothetical protein